MLTLFLKYNFLFSEVRIIINVYLYSLISLTDCLIGSSTVFNEAPMKTIVILFIYLL